MCTKIKYSFLKETDLYTFFNLREVKVEEYLANPNHKLYTLKTGGFQNHIDMEIDVLEDDILKAVLYLDREWIGNEKNINPFGKDLMKSFLVTLIPPEVNKEFKIFLVESIWNLKGDEDIVICMDKVMKSWENCDITVKKYLDVYRGIKRKTSLEIEDFYLKMENLIHDQKQRLITTLKWTN